jgi:hypothetical protein
MSDPRELLNKLDSRHDELIRKLDELNAQIEQALEEFSKNRAAEANGDMEANAAVQPTRRAA